MLRSAHHAGRRRSVVNPRVRGVGWSPDAVAVGVRDDTEDVLDARALGDDRRRVERRHERSPVAFEVLDHAASEAAPNQVFEQPHGPGRRAVISRVVQGRDHGDGVHQPASGAIERSEERHRLRQDLVHLPEPPPQPHLGRLCERRGVGREHLDAEPLGDGVGSAQMPVSHRGAGDDGRDRETRGDQGKSREKFRVAVSLNDLGRNIGWLEPKFFANVALDSGIQMSVSADRSA